MKSYFYFGLLLLSVFLCVSCNEQDEDFPSPENPSGKTYNVSLNLIGDIISTEEEPLDEVQSRTSKTPTDTNYGINVYYRKQNSKDAPWKQYGYAVFNDLQNMTITLIDSHEYKFECTAIKNLQDTLYYGEFPGVSIHHFGSGFGFGTPFCSNYPGTEIFIPYQLGNKLVLNDVDVHKDNILYIKNSLSTICDRNRTFVNDNFPKLDRYYGEISGYTPTPEEQVTIKMKRCVFGMQLNLKSLSDGEIDIYTLNRIFHFTKPEKRNKEIHTYRYPYEYWKDPTHTFTETIEIRWTRENGIEQKFRKEIVFKPNVMTIINIDFNGETNKRIFKLECEDSPMIDENHDWIIEGDTLIDVGIK